jgi:2'-5' RNA ligase
VSPFPAQMEDHWAAERAANPSRKRLIWFMLFADQPQVAELACLCHARLAGLGGLDLVPPQWLHLTTLIAGNADEITPGQARAMADHAGRVLARVPPVRVTLGRVLYHPRAVMLDAGPAAALEPVLHAAQEATRAATGRDGSLHTAPWTPHITLAYSNTTGPAAPVIAALGRRLPERVATISSVSLVAQAPEQSWTWDPVAQVRLGPGSEAGNGADSRDPRQE